MKKSSTAAAASKKNFNQKLTIGLDLGDRSSWYCVLDEAGEIMSEQKLSTTPKAMKDVFTAMPRSRVALETGTHSPWVRRSAVVNRVKVALGVGGLLGSQPRPLSHSFPGHTV